jgi:hypothetical protein
MLQEEPTERLIEGNKAFYVNQKMLQSKLLSRKSNLKLYWTLIRPVIMYKHGFLKKIVYRNS